MIPDPVWSSGPPSGTLNEGLHEAFARVAASQGNSNALIVKGEYVSYSDLDRDSDMWAVDLDEQGITRGDFVPIVLQRNKDLVTAILAVLKVGAAYSLIDPYWPARKIVDLVGMLNAKLVISSEMLELKSGTAIWSPCRRPQELSNTFRPVHVNGDEPCCIFFTSGTTGIPKGVISPHRATMRLFEKQTFGSFTENTVIPLAASVPWDAFSLELWGALLNGGTCLIVEEPFLSAQTLRDGIRDHGVNTAWLTGSLFDMIVSEDSKAFTGLLSVMIGGERLSVSHVDKFLCRYPNIALFNGYGPVESTIFATTHQIFKADCDRETGIPLGRPVTGTQIFVLDGTRLCDISEEGEICIAGDGLALGYLRDPKLTNAKFVDIDLYGSTYQAFRTGDRGFWSNDGVLNFAGRMDRQIKIRGHRIEPAQLENHIKEILPGVQSCRVLAKLEGGERAKKLIAFCQIARKPENVAEVLKFVNAELLPYQRIAIIYFLEKFPLTPAGKLDEKSLIEKNSSCSRIASKAEDVEICESDSMRTVVRKVFISILGTFEVAENHSFFELGGDSLGAGRVCARLSKLIGHVVPIVDFYRFPSIESLAGHICEIKNRTTSSTPPSDSMFQLGPMQLVFLTRYLSDPADRSSHCLLAWIVEGNLKRDLLESAIASVHERHDALRSAYIPDPKPDRIVLDLPPPTLEVFDTCENAKQAFDELQLVLDEQLDITSGDNWRTVIIPISYGNVNLFGCVVHHIAFDGWSEAILAKDLSAAYNTLISGDESDLPLPASTQSLNQKRIEYFNHLDLDFQRSLLTDTLVGQKDFIWPTNQKTNMNKREANTEVSSSKPCQITSSITKVHVDGISLVARDISSTPFAIFLSSYAKSLAEIVEAKDVLIGAPVRQRVGSEAEQVIGCMMNMVFFRFHGAALGDGIGALKAAAKIVRTGLAYQDVDFADAVQLAELLPSSRRPLVQTIFVFHDQPAPDLNLKGCDSRLVRPPYLGLAVDLVTEIWRQNDGSAQIVVSFLSDIVSPDSAKTLLSRLNARLISYERH